MTNFLVINKSGFILNRVALDNGSDWQPEDGSTLIAEPENGCDIGGTLIDGVYTPPYREPEPAPPILVPASASKLGLKRAFAELKQWDVVKAMIASDTYLQEDWDLAVEIRRTDPLVQSMIKAMSLTEAQVDELLIRSKELVS